MVNQVSVSQSNFLEFTRESRLSILPQINFTLFFVLEIDEEICFSASDDISKPNISESGHNRIKSNNCFPVPHPRSRIFSWFFSESCFKTHLLMLYFE